MTVLWRLLKVVIALAILIPISLIVLGTVVGLAALAFRLALLGLVAYVGFKLVARLVRGPKPSTTPKALPLERVDPHFDAAMRELDRELGVK